MKRKIIAWVLLMSLLLAGCGVSPVEKEGNTKNSMFVLVEETGSWRVVYHKETKVMYAVSASGYNYGTFTLLVNADGSPMLWED